MIAAEKLSLGTFTVEQDACSHPVTFELLEPLSFISIEQSNDEIFVQTNELLDASTYQVQTKASISFNLD